MLDSYLTYTIEAKDMVSVRRGHMTNMHFHKYQAVRAEFALAFLPETELTINILAAFI